MTDSKADLLELAHKHRELTSQLENAVSNAFPRESVVILDGKHQIWGLVHGKVAGFPDELSILHENGNVWTRNIAALTRVVDAGLFPNWIREHFSGR